MIMDLFGMHQALLEQDTDLVSIQWSPVLKMAFLAICLVALYDEAK